MGGVTLRNRVRRSIGPRSTFSNRNGQPVGPVRNAWSGRAVEVKAMEISSIPRPPADVSRLHRRERQQQPEMISIIRHAPRLRSAFGPSPD